jgi:hypothetical protein
MYKLLFPVIAVAAALGPAFAQQGGAPQPAGQAYPVELSMPFGVANGNAVVSGDYLIFVNNRDVGNSFVVPRSDVQSANIDNSILTLTLRSPVQVASQSQSRLNLRFTNPSDADSIVRWTKEATADRAANPPSGANAASVQGQQFSYQVKHDHLMGSCTGRLIATQDRLVFESMTDINHSRQWAMKDIKEVQHKNPYKLHVQPFTGDDYSFEFIGQGMDNADFALLTKLIADARASRQ